MFHQKKLSEEIAEARLEHGVALLIHGPAATRSHNCAAPKLRRFFYIPRRDHVQHAARSGHDKWTPSGPRDFKLSTFSPAEPYQEYVNVLWQSETKASAVVHT